MSIFQCLTRSSIQICEKSGVRYLHKTATKTKFPSRRARAPRKDYVPPSPYALVPNEGLDYLHSPSSILAALLADKREFFRLWVYSPEKSTHDGGTDSENESRDLIIKLAKERLIPINFEKEKTVLNSLTKRQQHKGIVLSASPLELPVLRHLGPQLSDKSYGMAIGASKYYTNGPMPQFKQNNTIRRYPLGIYFDEITDTHNMGAIVRTAYFLGADFLVQSERNCAPLNAGSAKTSAGATEFMKAYTTLKPLSFFERSIESGWNCITTATVENKDQLNPQDRSKYVSLNNLSELLHKGPCLLVLGSEGRGVRSSLANLCTHIVSISKKNQDLNPVVDCLNVSVACGILLHELLK